MTDLAQWFKNRKLERLSLLMIAGIMGLLFWKLFTVLQRDFADVPSRLANGTMINLNEPKCAGQYEKGCLKTGLYFEDEKDIAFIASSLDKKENTWSVWTMWGSSTRKNIM